LPRKYRSRGNRQVTNKGGPIWEGGYREEEPRLQITSAVHRRWAKKGNSKKQNGKGGVGRKKDISSKEANVEARGGITGKGGGIYGEARRKKF